MIRIIEIGPFGSKIDRGKTNSLEDLPDGYEIKKIEDKKGIITIYVEPTQILI
jgi:hypothetical protein